MLEELEKTLRDNTLRIHHSTKQLNLIEDSLTRIQEVLASQDSRRKGGLALMVKEFKVLTELFRRDDAGIGYEIQQVNKALKLVVETTNTFGNKHAELLNNLYQILIGHKELLEKISVDAYRAKFAAEVAVHRVNEYHKENQTLFTRTRAMMGGMFFLIVITISNTVLGGILLYKVNHGTVQGTEERTQGSRSQDSGSDSQVSKTP